MKSIAATETSNHPHPGLAEIPLVDPDLILSADGSYLHTPKQCFQVKYTITNFQNPVEYEPLPNEKSAKRAKFMDLARACTLAKDRKVNVYTCSG